MRLQRNHFKQSIALASLTLAFVVAGAAPLLSDGGVEAARKSKRSARSERIQAEAVQSFSNPANITINEGTNGNPAPGTPYPSTIEVSGFTAPIADIEVTLHNFRHVNPSDVGVLLVGPGGQMAGIFSGRGNTIAAPGVTITLDDQAPNEVPSQLVSGTFQPNGSAGRFPAPAPAQQSTGSALSVFNGTDPNGTWRLFVADFLNPIPNSTGAIAGGWSMRIRTANGAPSAAPDSFSAQAGKVLVVPGPGILANDSDPDGDSLTPVVTSQPRQGSLELRPDGSFTYRANKKAKGSDRFEYLVQDEDGLKAVSSVEIQIKKAKKKGKKHGRRR